MLHRRAVDDAWRATQLERRDRRVNLLGPRRGGDRPRDARLVEAREQLARARKRPGVAVVLVEERAGTAVERIGEHWIRAVAGAAKHVCRETTAVHADHRLQSGGADLDSVLGERLLPCGDPSTDRVDERPIEIEDDRPRTGQVLHRTYDTEPMPSELAAHWILDPGVVFLNHGSFGATPRPVLEAQDAWRARMEREPVAFFTRDLEPALDAARAALGAFVGADPDDLAFVPNATTGINIVAASLRLEAGDEIVVTDHAYPAARNALATIAERAGARLVSAAIPYPGTTPSSAVDAVLGAVGERTRLVLMDHVTSATALVLPVAKIVEALAARGIDTLVDAAHSPGMVELDLDAIGAAYTTGNCHKWLCAPKGSGFLHVRRDRQDRVRPVVISHGATSERTDRSRFRLEHDWTGTLDPTPWLAVPAAIDFGARLVGGGWPALRERGHSLAVEARDLLCEVLGERPPAPDDMLGAMASVPMPATEERPPSAADDDPIGSAVLASGVRVAIGRWPQRPVEGEPWRRVVRVSCAPYVDRDDLEAMARALAAAVGAAQSSDG
jgi:isopenicillin-N epimerase